MRRGRLNETLDYLNPTQSLASRRCRGSAQGCKRQQGLWRRLWHRGPEKELLLRSLNNFSPMFSNLHNICWQHSWGLRMQGQVRHKRPQERHSLPLERHSWAQGRHNSRSGRHSRCQHQIRTESRRKGR